MTDNVPENAQRPGESLQDWLKRRDKVAKDGIEAREEEAKKLEAERLEKERLEEEGEASVKAPWLHPSEGGEEEAAPVEEPLKAVEEVPDDSQRIVVPEGFEVTRLIYGPDGEPTAVYIDRKSGILTGDKLPAFIFGALTGVFFMMAVRYFIPVALSRIMEAMGGFI